MIRPFTCACLLLAAGAGLYTYQAKHQSELLDREIARVLKAADAARQRSGVLRAEYALLNDPSRLAELASTHLPDLHATEPRQFTNLAELDRRLPPVGAAPSVIPPIEEPPAVEPVPLSVIPIASSAAPQAKPAATPAASSQLAYIPPPTAPVTSKPSATIEPRPAIVAQSPAPSPPPASRTKPPAQKVAAARPARAEPFVTPVASPTEALSRLARSPTIAGGTGGATVSALGMARTAALYPAAQAAR